MGHRLSKLNWSSSISRNNTNQNSKSNLRVESSSSQRGSEVEEDIITNRIINNNSNNSLISETSSSSTIDVIATTTADQNLHIESATLTVPGQSVAPRRFIIKIQLTKMEPGVSSSVDATVSTSVTLDNNSQNNDNLDNNLNNNKPILNLTFTKNILCDSNTSVLTSDQIVIDTNEIKLNNLNTTSNKNSNSHSVNSNFVNNFKHEEKNNINDVNTNCQRLNHFNNSTNNARNSNNNSINNNPNNCSTISNDSNLIEMNLNNINTTNCINNNSICIESDSINRYSNEFNEVPDKNDHVVDCNSGFSTLCGEDGKNHCCRRKKSTSYPSKWRCCKCACRDNSKTVENNSATISTEVAAGESCSKATSGKRNWTTKFNCAKRNNNTPQEDNVNMWSPPQLVAQTAAAPCVQQHLIQTLARCTGGSPNLFVFSVNHPQPSQFVVGPLEDCDERARRLRALEIENGVDPPPGFMPQQQPLSNIQSAQMQSSSPFVQQGLSPDIGSALANAISSPNAWHMLCTSPGGLFGTVVHSQVDYIHCLVPDLEKITSSSFYWGKMDRYEAERLLEGKPEGTFLLRDSAQEEYLFSVTFRKYGRSLHARIEQFNHKFSFDCHDPGVFTAPTVTGLLEHYKDPSCVMFFEPMLTIPLNRNFTFSLQQLCRATIVSNIKYDGINELQLPNSLKGYLKEYHYKLRVRVKPFDEPFYTCS